MSITSSPVQQTLADLVRRVLQDMGQISNPGQIASLWINGLVSGPYQVVGKLDRNLMSQVRVIMS